MEFRKFHPDLGQNPDINPIPRARNTTASLLRMPSYCLPCPTKTPFMETAEKVSAMVLTILAAITNISLFVPFFLIGCAYGVYTECTDPSGSSCVSSGGGCSQGFLEEITGIRLPKPVSLIANTAITYCHIEHHSDVFVPLVGIISGMKMGKECHKVLTWLQENPEIISQKLPFMSFLFPAAQIA